MSEASKLRRRIASMDFELSILNVSLARAKCEEMVNCSHCETKTKVKKTTLLKFHYYVEPSGCSAGDYWSFRCYATVCDKCQHVEHASENDALMDESGFLNRHYDFIVDHLDQFGEVLDVHREQIGWFYMNGETLQEILDDSRQKKAA